MKQAYDKFGNVHVYSYAPKPIILARGGNAKVNIDNLVRQCAVSDDASILITLDDNSNLFQYERYLVHTSPTSRRSTIRKPKRDVEIESESWSSVEHDHYMQDVLWDEAAAIGYCPAPRRNGGGNVSANLNSSTWINENGVGLTSSTSTGRDSDSSTTSGPQLITRVIQNASPSSTRNTPTRSTQ